MKQNNNLDKFFSGKVLYGDNFSSKEIKKWYRDEKEGYAQLEEDYEDGYAYEALNMIHGFKKLPKGKKFKRVLMLGGAKGEEILSIAEQCEKIVILEPSQKLKNQTVLDKGKVKYITPSPKGKILFKNKSFDLITCFGVLHHIPNVNFVFSEMKRVLKKGGFLLLREPTVSMGDWRDNRKGLTKRERGIPEEYFEKLIKKHKLRVLQKRRVLFPFLRRTSFFGVPGGRISFFVYMDSFLSFLFSWNNKYHATKFWHKIRPQSIFYVLQK